MPLSKHIMYCKDFMSKKSILCRLQNLSTKKQLESVEISWMPVHNKTTLHFMKGILAVPLSENVTNFKDFI